MFSHNCPECRIDLPGGEHLVVLVNHFKSKLGSHEANRRRRRQAVRAAGIYTQLI